MRARAASPTRMLRDCSTSASPSPSSSTVCQVPSPTVATAWPASNRPIRPPPADFSRGQNDQIAATTCRNIANGPPCQRSTSSSVISRCQADRLARSRASTAAARSVSSRARSRATPAARSATGARTGSSSRSVCRATWSVRSTAPVRRTRRAARPTSSSSIAVTSSRNPASASRPAAERRAASTASSRKIRGTSNPCASSSCCQSGRMSGSREACVCTKNSGRPGANAASSRATIHERYFCAVDTTSSTSHAGTTVSSRSRLWLESLGRGGLSAGAASSDCVSGSGQSTSTMLATAGESLRTTRACIRSSGSHEQSTSVATTTTGVVVVGRATSPAAVTVPPASAFTSVLLPVPVPPITPTTSTRESSRRARSSRGSICSHAPRTRCAGGHSGSEPLQAPSAATSASKAASSKPPPRSAGAGVSVAGSGEAVMGWKTPVAIRAGAAGPPPPRAALRPRRAGRSPRHCRRARHHEASRQARGCARPTSRRTAARAAA